MLREVMGWGSAGVRLKAGGYLSDSCGGGTPAASFFPWLPGASSSPRERGMAGQPRPGAGKPTGGPPGGSPPNLGFLAPAGRPGRPGSERGGQCVGPEALGGPSLTIFPLFVFLNLGGPNSCRIP